MGRCGTPVLGAPHCTDSRRDDHPSRHAHDSVDEPTPSYTHARVVRTRFGMVFYVGSPHIHTTYDDYKVIL